MLMILLGKRVTVTMYDPNQSFKLTSSVAASSPSKQEDFHNLSCKDIYETSEAKGDKATEAVTLPIKKEIYKDHRKICDTR